MVAAGCGNLFSKCIHAEFIWRGCGYAGKTCGGSKRLCGVNLLHTKCTVWNWSGMLLKRVLDKQVQENKPNSGLGTMIMGSRELSLSWCLHRHVLTSGNSSIYHIRLYVPLRPCLHLVLHPVSRVIGSSGQPRHCHCLHLYTYIRLQGVQQTTCPDYITATSFPQ